MFNPHLEIGQCINNEDIRRIFKCGNMGGMRRSHTTGTLVIVSDYTKGLYHDKWIGGVLHYTGMALSYSYRRKRSSMRSQRYSRRLRSKNFDYCYTL